ncbi:alpha/beta hydrolase family protein [Paenibacillus radicis (ex Xue et al. 2023)]|uniref:Alpha/beta fold hydrolase n=1 Tax=Paenibacillus radicis (ex Xue et al. 2023) TaxID=2972489 RepID=A0ABT1YG72_9BACL|nr:alpha/beta fold hydrolase [Paenibacillus radicis (ex Xue et al. 2023)]MCR8632199.1 alpha/beta fold hydrolase [Paenibacillus radicis (ex Xue et al. 2023)]
MNNFVNCKISGIPSLIINPPEIPRAAVLLYHGWASKIENYLFFASLISSWGYKVIVPELPNHGVRGKLNYFETQVLQEYFWNTVLQGVKEVEEIVSALSEFDDISIIGHSSGGFIAAGAFSKISGLHSAIAINGSCAWVKFEELYREKDGRPPLTDIERKLLKEHDPLSNVNFGGNKRLLLLHGKEDSTIPIESQKYFMNEMANVSSEYLQLVEYPGVNHQITIGMLEKSNEWLDNILLSHHERTD